MKHNRSRGQALVELALVLPVLVVLLFGLTDLLHLMYAYNTIANMSREGADLASRPVPPAKDDPPLEYQDIMNSLANAAPIEMNKNGMMYITQITGGSGSTPSSSVTSWAGHTGSSSTVDAGTLAKALGLGEGEVVYVFEVFYKVDAVFLPYLSQVVRSTAIFK